MMDSSHTNGMTIAVTEPIKYNDSFGSYISYKIVSKSRDSDQEYGVIRRYSDFVWLAGELGRVFPGCILPALPEKQTVGRFSSEFVESRRRALEKFLRRIVDHGELCTSASFTVFLQAEDAAFNEAKDAGKQSKGKIGERAKGWLEASINTLSVSSKVELPKTETDTKIEEMAQYIAALEKQLANVTKHSALMVKKSRESAHTIFEFAQSLTWLGQSEGDALGTALTEVGAALDTLSVTATKHAESEVAELEEPFEEYSRYTASVKAAIAARNEKRLALIAALTDVKVKEAAHQKASTNPKEKDLAGKEEAVRRAQVSADNAELEYNNVSNRLLVEFENFKKQKSNDIRTILLSFVNLQIEFCKTAEQSWSDLIPTLEKVALTSPSPSYVPQASFANPAASFGAAATTTASAPPANEYTSMPGMRDSSAAYSPNTRNNTWESNPHDHNHDESEDSFIGASAPTYQHTEDDEDFSVGV